MVQHVGMAKLKDRQRQIPYGFKFSIPELKYNSSPYASFTAIVNSVHNALNANPELAAKKGWPTEYDAICELVDSYNAGVCESNGWKDYFVSTGPPVQMAKPSWPIWAKAVALGKTDSDAGVGDTVERLIGKENSEAFKAFYKKTFGKVCGCNGRKNEWNAKYKYLPS